MMRLTAKKPGSVNSRLVILLSILMLAGCSTISRTSSTSDDEIRLNRTVHLLQLKKVSKAADYALYYEGETSPEIPVRVNAGDNVGFFSDTDGRLKAIAGKFKMDIDPKRNRAVWKRYDLQ